MGTWCFSSVHTHNLFCFGSCWTRSYNSLQNEVTWVGVPTKTTHFFVGDHNVRSFWHILPSNSFNWPSCVSNWAKKPVISYKKTHHFLIFCWMVSQMIHLTLQQDTCLNGTGYLLHFQNIGASTIGDVSPIWLASSSLLSDSTKRLELRRQRQQPPPGGFEVQGQQCDYFSSRWIHHIQVILLKNSVNVENSLSVTVNMIVHTN